MIEILLVLLILIGVGYFIIKNYNPTIILMLGAFLLMIAGIILNHPLYEAGEGTGFVLFDMFSILKDTIKGQLSGAGLILMILFGYSGYMNKIGANQVAVDLLVKPMKNIKSQAIFILFVFYLGNLMSLVVPSASSLAIILTSILYPMLQGMGISSLTAAGVIAMTATIMPTPLGADNVIAAETLNMDLMEYVGYNAKISIPVLILLGIIHYFWQTYCDKKEGENAFIKIDESKLKEEKASSLPKIYALLPVLPLLLIVGVGIAGMYVKGIKMDVFILTFISFIIALLFEIVRTKNFKAVTDGASQMFLGMGEGFGRVVMLVVAGSLFTKGVQILGVIDNLIASVQNSNSAGIITMVIFAFATCVFGVLSGGGLPMFYATISLIPEIAQGAGIHGMLISLPMQMIANLARTISPVAAVVMIVASTIGVSPIRILKRTAVPSIIAILLVMVFSLLILPF